MAEAILQDGPLRWEGLTTLLVFYDFPAEHWKHVRMSNPIESTFATVRLRTDKTKGCLSRETALALSASPTSLRGIGLWPMVFKLAKSAERHWRRLDNTKRLGQIIDGIRFCDGEPVKTPRVKPPLTSYPKFDHSRSWTLVALELRNRWAGRAEDNATFVNGNASIGVRRKR
jgi:hypothetical protein